MWLLLSWHYDCVLGRIKEEVEETGLLGAVNEVLSEVLATARSMTLMPQALGAGKAFLG